MQPLGALEPLLGHCVYVKDELKDEPGIIPSLLSAMSQCHRCCDLRSMHAQSFVERLQNFVKYWHFQAQDFIIVRPLVQGIL